MGILWDPSAPQKLAAYHGLLAEWNDRMNLTGDTDFETALDRLYMDSLAPLAIEGLFPQGAQVVDVGSGAGFPGLPLAIARPDMQVLLVDTLAKRVCFSEEVVEKLSLPNVRALHVRAEDGAHRPDLREAFDVATARAVAALPVLCELLLPFVRVGGQMVCYKGPSAAQEIGVGNRAAKLLGGGALSLLSTPVSSQPGWQHCVVVSRKEAATSSQYPRKAGLPVRKPLG